jgi:hypothetical protein
MRYIAFCIEGFQTIIGTNLLNDRFKLINYEEGDHIMKTPRGEISDSIVALANDETLLKKMSECKSPEEVYALVKDRVGIPFEQFTAEMTIAHSYLQEMEVGLLSEEDLDAVAGGKSKAETDETLKDVYYGLAIGSGAVGVVGLGFIAAI